MPNDGVTAFSARDLRNALGQFATGITVVTAPAKNGPPIGVTVNSFNSVSMEPPLILFSIARTLNRFDELSDAEAYTVNVLANTQERISHQFAASDGDKWFEVAWHPGEGGSPVLDGSLAAFECVPWAQYDGGDHVIFVGEVKRMRINETAEPLTYFRGRYGGILPRDE
jgi:flavin reductase (DIM6/NTAB) family NADH-FMN oxidoreductase RutF